MKLIEFKVFPIYKGYSDIIAFNVEDIVHVEPITPMIAKEILKSVNSIRYHEVELDGIDLIGKTRIIRKYPCPGGQGHTYVNDTYDNVKRKILELS